MSLIFLKRKYNRVLLCLGPVALDRPALRLLVFDLKVQFRDIILRKIVWVYIKFINKPLTPHCFIKFDDAIPVTRMQFYKGPRDGTRNSTLSLFTLSLSVMSLLTLSRCISSSASFQVHPRDGHAYAPYAEVCGLMRICDYAEAMRKTQCVCA